MATRQPKADANPLKDIEQGEAKPKAKAKAEPKPKHDPVLQLQDHGKNNKEGSISFHAEKIIGKKQMKQTAMVDAILEGLLAEGWEKPKGGKPDKGFVGTHVRWMVREGRLAEVNS